MLNNVDGLSGNGVRGLAELLKSQTAKVNLSTFPGWIKGHQPKQFTGSTCVPFSACGTSFSSLDAGCSQFDQTFHKISVAT